MRDFIPGRYFLLSVSAASVAGLTAGLATDSLAVCVTVSGICSSWLGWLAADAEREQCHA